MQMISGHTLVKSIIQAVLTLASPALEEHIQVEEIDSPHHHENSLF